MRSDTVGGDCDAGCGGDPATSGPEPVESGDEPGAVDPGSGAAPGAGVSDGPGPGLVLWPAAPEWAAGPSPPVDRTCVFRGREPGGVARRAGVVAGMLDVPPLRAIVPTPAECAGGRASLPAGCLCAGGCGSAPGVSDCQPRSASDGSASRPLTSTGTSATPTTDATTASCRLSNRLLPRRRPPRTRPVTAARRNTLHPQITIRTFVRIAISHRRGSTWPDPSTEGRDSKGGGSSAPRRRDGSTFPRRVARSCMSRPSTWRSLPPVPTALAPADARSGRRRSCSSRSCRPARQPSRAHASAGRSSRPRRRAQPRLPR